MKGDKDVDLVNDPDLIDIPAKDRIDLLERRKRQLAVQLMEKLINRATAEVNSAPSAEAKVTALRNYDTEVADLRAAIKLHRDHLAAFERPERPSETG